MKEDDPDPPPHNQAAPCLAAARWRLDTVQRALADSTKASYRAPMDAIMEKNGAKDMRATTRQLVRAALEGKA